MNQEVFNEKSPLKEKSSIAIFERNKQSFTFPIHFHDVYELNFVENADQATRIVGDSVEAIADKDLVLICNSTLPHAWKDGNCQSQKIHEITIQFSPSGFSSLFERPHFASIERMFHTAALGVVFSNETIKRVLPFLRTLTVEVDDFYLETKFLMLLYELSLDENYRRLASDVLNPADDGAMRKMHKFLKENIDRSISVNDIASYMGMSSATFFRYVKNHTGMNFSGYLLEFRWNAVLRELHETDRRVTIESLSEQYGFSAPYLYKIFKKRTGMTLVEYQKNRKKKLIRYI